MARNDNTVNIKSGKGPAAERYHHGDLRQALIEEGLIRLDAGPADALSLREVARNVGVSATAVYRHFPDKAALLLALCEVGGERLAEAFRDAMAASKPGVDAFNAMGRAYVRFALAHPSLFRLMMSRAPSPDAGPESTTGMEMLVQALDALGGPGLSKAQRDVQRVRAWALVHGLAMLMLDGLVPPDDALIDRVVSAG